MKSYEIFQEMSPESGAAVFQYLRDEQREVYTASLSSLATNRKLRPVFIQRKPAPAQIEWLARNVRLKANDEVAEHVIQLWLMKAHQGLLTQFLDGIGIEHDGEGAAEDLPEEISAKKLKSTVTKLLKEHDPEIVRIYLHVFQLQRPGGWQEIVDLVAATPELQFGEPEAEEPEAEEAAEEKAAPAEAATEEAEDAPTEAATAEEAPKKKTSSAEEE